MNYNSTTATASTCRIHSSVAQMMCTLRMYFIFALYFARPTTAKSPRSDSIWCVCARQNGRQQQCDEACIRALCMEIGRRANRVSTKSTERSAKKPRRRTSNAHVQSVSAARVFASDARIAISCIAHTVLQICQNAPKSSGIEYRPNISAANPKQ